MKIRAPVESAVESMARAGKNKTVLVVDDEEPIRALMARTLGKVGYQVYQAQDGEEAVSVWMNSTEPIDLVITDVSMPRCTGIQLTSRLWAVQPDLPILLISGYPRDDSESSLADGNIEFLAKPFRLDELLNNVGELLTRHEPVKLEQA